MHDLVIRGGQLVDGTGSAPVSGDLAIDGGRIASVGGRAGAGRREIDASGALVTPGFVDIHTHFDGQVTWDAHLSPSNGHGVTTAVFGNCGVGFAPARPSERVWLVDLMEGVEDIPGSALSEGIRWSWESFPEYLDALDAGRYAMDVGAQMPHGPLRTYVMGERGVANEEATERDIAEMSRLTREALDAGALGFSTSRVLIHKSKSGELVPGTFASRDELFGIGRAIAQAGHGVFQLTSIHASLHSEYAWIEELARTLGVTVQFNLQQADAAPEQWREVLAMIERAQAAGSRVFAGIAGRPAGLLFSWRSSLHPFFGYPSWREIAGLPWHEKLARLRDPAFRARMLAQRPRDLGEFANFMTRSHHKMFVLGDAPEYEPDPSTSIAARAEARGCSPESMLYDAMMADDGTALVYFPVFNYANGNMDHLVTLMRSEATVLSLGDGGAHCGVICDASLPTYMLTHWARDRARGERLPIEFVVRRLTHDTARSYGIGDRGVLAPGLRADINIIDHAGLRLNAPRMAFDLPTGARRLVQWADGYVATIVAGVPVRENGIDTGALPGRLIRAQR
ncbi:MAG: amidohydrolase family protein [Burkholderiaceae bacterium]|nr:amidohydrolase family protein [Burkholderiaceae bacterium]